MNKLYPLKFKPILKDKIWGGSRLKSILGKKDASDNCGESWEISDVKEDVSVIVNGFLAGNNLREISEIYMDDLLGDKVFNLFGHQFPLLVKFIDAKDKLSIQVHPDDKMAQEEENSAGKTEMWYIVEHEPDAELIVGFNQQIDKNKFASHLKDDALTELLNLEKVQKGDAFYIPAGRIHAIGSSILLVEVEQSSDITYRIFDWNRTDKEGNARPLHTEQALKAIDYNFYDQYKTAYDIKLNKTTNIIDSPYFVVNNLQFDKPVEKDYNLIDSFVIYIAIEGKFFINPADGNPVEVKKGECILIPAAIKNLTIEPLKLAKLLEVYIK
jgi:mannose-6-phosphate isomerase